MSSCCECGPEDHFTDQQTQFNRLQQIRFNRLVHSSNGAPNKYVTVLLMLFYWYGFTNPVCIENTHWISMKKKQIRRAGPWQGSVLASENASNAMSWMTSDRSAPRETEWSRVPVEKNRQKRETAESVTDHWIMSKTYNTKILKPLKLKESVAKRAVRPNHTPISRTNFEQWRVPFH